MSDETLTCLRCLQPYVYPVHQCPEPRERKPLDRDTNRVVWLVVEDGRGGSFVVRVTSTEELAQQWIDQKTAYDMKNWHYTPEYRAVTAVIDGDNINYH